MTTCTEPALTIDTAASSRRGGMWRWIGWLARVILAAVFLYAGVNKALNPAGLAEQVRNYHLAPWWLVHPIAIGLPWLEIVAGLLCLAGVWLIEAVIVLAGLLAVFIVGSGWAVYWGLDIDCGCFAGDSKAGWETIGRNLVLLAMAGLIVATRWRMNAQRRGRGG